MAELNSKCESPRISSSCFRTLFQELSHIGDPYDESLKTSRTLLNPQATSRLMPSSIRSTPEVTPNTVPLDRGVFVKAPFLPRAGRRFQTKWAIVLINPSSVGGSPRWATGCSTHRTAPRARRPLRSCTRLPAAASSPSSCSRRHRARKPRSTARSAVVPSARLVPAPGGGYNRAMSRTTNPRTPPCPATTRPAPPAPHRPMAPARPGPRTRQPTPLSHCRPTSWPTLGREPPIATLARLRRKTGTLFRRY